MSLVAYNSSSDESEEENKPVKKQKEIVKITIPSLKEFEDEDDEKPIAKKPKFQSGSGLFSLLPPPKNTPSAEKTGFVPHILLSKKEKPSVPSTQTKSNSAVASSPLITSVLPISASTASDEKELEEKESDDDNVSTKDSSNTDRRCDFFWLDDLASENKTVIEDPVSAPVKNGSFLQNLSSQLPSSSTNNMHHSYLNEAKEHSYLQQQQQMSTSTVEPVDGETDSLSSEQHRQLLDENYISNSSDGSQETLLNDKEFLKLQGRRREFENINIIDVNADDQLTDRNEWLMKSVTEETTHRPKKKHGLPTQQQKRKHQITYLAFQAKEREMDLKNQWGLNRLTRRETQSKYGF